MIGSTAEVDAEEQTSTRVRQVALGYTWMLGSRVLSLAFGALAAVLIPRWLGPEEYGNYSWVISVASFFLIFADFGISPSMARYVAQHNARRSDAVPAIVLDGIRLGLVFSLAFAIGNWIAAPWLVEQFASESLLWPLRIASFVIIAMSLRNLVALALQGLQRLGLMAGVSLFGNVVKALFSVMLVYLGLGVAGAVVGQAVGQGLAFVLGATILYRLFRERAWRRAGRPFLNREMLAYGLPIMLTGISFYIYTQSDSFLLRYFLDATQVGYYAMPLQLVMLMTFPAGALGATVAPMLAELQEKEQNPGTLLLASIRYTLILFVPLATYLFVVAHHFIELFYGSEYLPSVPVFRIYMPFFVLFALASVLSVSMNFLGLAKQRARAVVTAAFVKLLLALLVIPSAGIVGAAAVALVSYTGVLVMYFGVAIRHCRIEPHALLDLGWRVLIPAIATAGVAALLSRLADTPIGLGIVGFISASVFLMLLAALGGIGKHDWYTLRLALTPRK